MYHLSLSPRLWRMATGRLLAALAPLVAVAAFPVVLSAASPFTYQGRLNSSGGPASGAHDFEFGLYGSMVNADQVGTTVTVASVVVDGGLFSVQLDFGDNAFDSPSRWLDITVRPQGNGAFTPLAPRQPVTPAPAAHHAFSIADGSVTSAKLAAGAVDSANLSTTVSQGLVPSESYIMTLSETAPAGYTFTGMTGTMGSEGWAGAKASMPTARANLAAVSLNGKIYAVGGIEGNYLLGNNNPLSVNEEYDPATNTWTARAPMPTARGHHAAAVANGKFYALGGISGSGLVDINEEYDPVSNTWAGKAPMPARRSSFAAAASYGKVYAFSGQSDAGFISGTDEYDPITNTWVGKAPMSSSRYDFAAVTASNGRIYALGGNSAAGVLSVNEEYDPATNTWTEKAPMPNAQSRLSAAAAEHSTIYALGGIGNLSYSANYEYTPATNTWAVKAPVPTGRHSHSAAVANGKIYVLGGRVNDVLASNEEYTIPVLFYYHRKN